MPLTSSWHTSNSLKGIETGPCHSQQLGPDCHCFHTQWESPGSQLSPSLQGAHILREATPETECKRQMPSEPWVGQFLTVGAAPSQMMLRALKSPIF